MRVTRLPEEAESERKTRIDKIHRHTEQIKSREDPGLRQVQDKK